MYSRRAISPQQVVHALALPYTVVQRRFFVDELYTWYVERIQQRLIAGSCALVERFLIIGLMVNGTAALTRGMGYVVRLAQTGKIQLYVLGFLIGVLWFLSLVLFR